MRRLRRLVLLGILGGAGVAGFTVWRQRRPHTQQQLGPPDWPPMTVKPPTTSVPVAASVPPAEHCDDHETSGERAAWLAPVDGACPEGYPIKANDNSGIFHVPGGRFYTRTVPERCYADAADAERDGYRSAKA